MKDIILHVAAKALIVNDQGQVLIVRESRHHPTNTKAGYYQLPGGQLEKGESFMDGLKREVSEETGLEIAIGEPLMVGEWRPIILGVPHQIIGVFMACTVTDDSKARLSDEHDDMQWIEPGARKQYDIVGPDWQAIDAFIARVR
jgi:8-oxo-dGTP diphosphatase